MSFPLPRRARLIAAGYPMHIILRGIDRSALFFRDEDDQFFLDEMAALAPAEGVSVHAYVLMTNHVHLLMTADGDGGIPRLMKRLGQRYVQSINRAYRRTGTLFEGRFRSSLIEADAYLLACYRYLELNPVRARMVNRPEDYPWSSYGANALGHPSPLVTPHPLYLSLGADVAQRQEAYRQLFDEALDEPTLTQIRETAKGGFVLGHPRFQQQIAAMLDRRTWRGSPGRPKKALAQAQKELDLAPSG